MFPTPPYTITDKATDYLAKIIEAIHRLSDFTMFAKNIRLHRENRLRTVHSSVAIEGNLLSYEEVSAVLDGKRIIGRQKEIGEVKNAYNAYDKIKNLNPYSVKDFLLAHKYMMTGLIPDAGKFRDGDVGVSSGETLIHIGARPQFVPMLITDLFGWAKNSELHPVLKGAVLHYEIETIHPFSDGNGRIGRLWQTLLLTKWNRLFAWIPMEALLYQNRPDYYRAISDSRKQNDSGIFIEFTLSAIYDSIKHQVENQVKHQDEPAEIKILKALLTKPLSGRELFDLLGLSKNTRAVKRYITPLLLAGLIAMTIPDKPNSKMQKYRITELGKTTLEEKMQLKF